MSSKKITTVCGDIAPEQLGFTSMHDHTFPDMHVTGAFMEAMFPDVTQEMVAFRPENYSFLKTGTYLMCKELQTIDDLEGMVREYGVFKALGGQSVCDPVPSCCRGDIRKTKELSEQTGIHFIVATGIYHQNAIPMELRDRDVDFYYDYCRKEIDGGIDGTDIRPGVLKAALATGCPTEQNVVEACIRLTAETGMSTHIHTEPTMSGEVIVSLLDTLCDKYQVSHERIQICHMDNRIAGGVMVADYLNNPATDRTLNLELHKTLLGKGCNIGLDTWGMPVENMYFFMPDDFERLKALITLIDLGYGNQITLGNDFSSKLMWRACGGHGCVRFIEFGLRMMEQLGRAEQAHKLVYENPARILAY